MARYPTFEDYEKRGNYADGIKRCNDLLKKNPNDVQLLVLKVRLLAANHNDVTGLVDQLVTIQPPLQDHQEIALIEEAVVSTLADVYPPALTAGPTIAKLWENAYKSARTMNVQLDLLATRFSQAVFDSRLADAQQTLIQLKSLQPKNRALFMGHAAYTQLLSSSKEDLQSRLALSLARKAVSERFDDDSALDCRVPGQIFAIQNSSQDLQAISERPFRESKQVYEALKLGQSIGNDLADPLKAIKVSDLPLSREWLISEIASRKLEFSTLIDSNASPEQLAQFAAGSVRLFQKASSSPVLSESRVLADAAFLAISALIKVHIDGRCTNMQSLLQAAFICETVVSKNPHVHEARLIGIYIYMRLSLGSLAMRHFDFLSIKEVQYDTVGHALFTRISVVHPFGTSLLPASREIFEPLGRLQRALEMYIRHNMKLAETEAGILEHAQTGLILDIQKIRRSLRKSVSRRISVLEYRRVARLTGKVAGRGVVDIGPRRTANWTEVEDTRDYAATFRFSSFNLEEALSKTNESLPGRLWVTHALAIDTVWALAKEQNPLVTDTANVINLLQSESALDSGELLPLEITATQMAFHLLVIMTATINTEAALLETSVNGLESILQRITSTESPDSQLALNIQLEAIPKFYITIDILRTFVVASRTISASSPLKASSSLLDKFKPLQTIAEKHISTLYKQAQRLAFGVKPSDIENLLFDVGESDVAHKDALGQGGQELVEVLKGFGDRDVQAFCEKVKNAVKEGWDGVSKIPLV